MAIVFLLCSLYEREPRASWSSVMNHESVYKTKRERKKERGIRKKKKEIVENIVVYMLALVEFFSHLAIET